jgi:histidinol-phosphate aminotransferase
VTIKAKKYVEDIKPYKQGKSQSNFQGKIVKLSSNENALGCSKKAIEAYQQHSQYLSRYADGNCLKLKEAIAKKYNIEPEQIVCGAGSDELISLLIQNFANEGEELIQSEYGFLMYSISAQKFGVKTIKAKETNLTTNVDNIINLISSKTRIIFIANPNNPTGSHINKAQIEKLIENTPKSVIVVLDLAYGEYVNLSEEEYPDVVKIVKKHQNVVMLRTFSKIYGLASLRLGWSYSSKYIAQILNKSRGPFNVSGASIVAGRAAIEDEDFIIKSQNYNNQHLVILKKQLKEIGLKTYPSIANFILIDFKEVSICKQVNEYLLENGVIVRDLKVYNLPTCLRMTIGKEEENNKLVSLLKSFIKTKSL